MRERESRTLLPETLRSFAVLGRLAALITLSLFAGQASHAADQPGTVGLGLAQLYSDQEANHRGYLIVVHVEEGSPAAKAGILPGDVLLTVNGVPVSGREPKDIVRKEVYGPAGGEVRLHLVRPPSDERDVTLTRAPFPPHRNPASDSFAYVIPGHWTVDPRYSFPLPWAPALNHRGVEDLAFTPNFDDATSPEYHSYLFFWWIEGAPLTAQQLEGDMVAYFRGLAADRGKNYKFTPDLTRIDAKYTADSGARTFGGAHAKTFSGIVHIYDTKGKVIALNSEVVMAACPGSNHTALFFGMSQEPRDKPIWSELDAVRDGFKCSR